MPVLKSCSFCCTPILNCGKNSDPFSCSCLWNTRPHQIGCQCLRAIVVSIKKRLQFGTNIYFGYFPENLIKLTRNIWTYESRSGCPGCHSLWQLNSSDFKYSKYFIFILNIFETKSFKKYLRYYSFVIFRLKTYNVQTASKDT